MISGKQRNWIQKIKNKLANARQHKQRKMIQIYIKIKLRKEITKNDNDGTKYNIKQLRQNPGNPKQK